MTGICSLFLSIFILISSRFGKKILGSIYVSMNYYLKADDKEEILIGLLVEVV